MSSEVGIDPQSLTYGFLNKIVDHPCWNGGLVSCQIGYIKFNDVLNLMKDVPNFVKDVPRVRKCVPKWGATRKPQTKWFGADPRFGKHFWTLGTSFTKFGTSDPIASETPIWTWMVHNYIYKPIRKWLGVDPHFGLHFRTLGTSFTKFGTSDPSDSGTLFWAWMSLYFILKPITKWFGADPHFGSYLEPLVHP